MREIPLSRGLATLIDDIDFESVVRFKWCAQRGFGGRYYAVRGVNGHLIQLHRYLLGVEPYDPIEIDHRNGNGLDNRRENLRKATTSQNQWNRGPNKKGSSRYKGVRWDSRENRWVATITANKTKIFIGQFRIEEDAAAAYDRVAKCLHGEFAYQNFP